METKKFFSENGDVTADLEVQAAARRHVAALPQFAMEDPQPVGEEGGTPEVTLAQGYEAGEMEDRVGRQSCTLSP